MDHLEELRDGVAAAVDVARETKPLIGSITNTVTQNFVANAEIAVGGSAAMVYLPDEGEFLAEAASAMYLNLGTLIPVYGETMARTSAALNRANKPWVLDPVGIGIGSLRAQIIDALIDAKPTIVRGNASEIIALARAWKLLDDEDASGPRGVDSVDEVAAARSAAATLARYTGGAVMVSGKTDLVTDGRQTALVEGGSSYFAHLTGAGCSLGGVASVYAAVSDPFIAALTATAIYDVAGERAAGEAEGPASFQVAFLDELHRIPSDIVASVSFSVEEEPTAEQA